MASPIKEELDQKNNISEKHPLKLKKETNNQGMKEVVDEAKTPEVEKEKVDEKK